MPQLFLLWGPVRPHLHSGSVSVGENHPGGLPAYPSLFIFTHIFQVARRRFKDAGRERTSKLLPL